MISTDDVIAYMWPDQPVTDAQNEQVAQAVNAAESFVDNYTRGRYRDAQGSTRPGVDGVILTIAARMVANPGQVSTSRTAGVMTENIGKGFQGLTLGEQVALDRWRTRSVSG